MYNKAHMKRFFIITISLIIIILGGGLVYAKFLRPDPITSDPVSADSIDGTTLEEEIALEKPLVTHLKTPKPVKAIYVSSWVAGTPSIMKKIINIIETTEVNAVVLDIKDATGRVSFLTDEPLVVETGSPENRIKNIREFINDLHSKNIYVIGRISTFQDPYLTKVRPDWAITRKSDGAVWKDRKGLSFLDPANEDVWNYTLAVARASYNVGFDEINFDYIRYPSDGNMKDIDYKLLQKADGSTSTRADHIEDFMKFVNESLRSEFPEIVTSADLFGLTTTEKTDMGIGQILEKALPHFDYIGPMTYPSHYANGEYGIASPAKNPGLVITKALAGAKQKIDTMKADPNLSEEVRNRISYEQIRPWLQDFSINGVTYTADMVRAQIQATYDSGMDSWMMWDPSNKYTLGAYLAQ